MNYEEIRKAIDDGKYHNPVTLVDILGLSREEQTARHREYAVKQHECDDLFREDCQAAVDLAWPNGELTSGQFGVLYGRAWENGHSGGYAEVLTCLEEVVDLVSLFTLEEGA